MKRSRAGGGGSVRRPFPADGFTEHRWCFDDAAWDCIDRGTYGANLLPLGAGHKFRSPGLFRGAAELVLPVGGGEVGGFSDGPGYEGNDLTLEAWFRARTTAGFQMIVCKPIHAAGAWGAGEIALAMYLDGAYVEAVCNCDAGTRAIAAPVGFEITDTGPHHVAVTRHHGLGMILYLDGQPVAFDSGAQGDLPLGNGVPWSVGCIKGHAATQGLFGSVTDVRISSEARPDAYFESVWRAGVNLP